MSKTWQNDSHLAVTQMSRKAMRQHSLLTGIARNQLQVIAIGFPESILLKHQRRDEDSAVLISMMPSRQALTLLLSIRMLAPFL